MTKNFATIRCNTSHWLHKRGRTLRNNLKGRKSAKNTMERFAERIFFPDLSYMDRIFETIELTTHWKNPSIITIHLKYVKMQWYNLTSFVLVLIFSRWNSNFFERLRPRWPKIKPLPSCPKIIKTSLRPCEKTVYR